MLISEEKPAHHKYMSSYELHYIEDQQKDESFDFDVSIIQVSSKLYYYGPHNP